MLTLSVEGPKRFRKNKALMGISYVKQNDKRLLRGDRTPIEHIRSRYHRKVSHVHKCVRECYQAHCQWSRQFDSLDWIPNFRQGIVGIGISNIRPSPNDYHINQKSTLKYPPDNIIHSSRKRVSSEVGAFPECFPCVIVGLIVSLTDSKPGCSNQAQEARPRNQYQDNQLERSKCVLKP